jgi:transcription initiation factor IIF auxiliary subunit
MTLAIAQNQKYEGDDWWKWSLWIEGTDEDLERIEAVTYTLHPTFPEPVRIITDRASKFQLKCAGWGVFTIPVEIRLKGGKTLQLEHDLQLAYPEASGAA